MRIAFLVAALFAVGCGSGSDPTVAVSGSVVKGGKPFTFATQGLPPGDPGFRLAFHGPDGAGAETNFATFNPNDGSFTVPGPKRKGLKAGKYRVSVEKGAMGAADEFKNVFSKDRSPLTAEVPAAGSAAFEIDLDKKAVTKK